MKVIFVIIIISTFFLNLILTYYLLRENAGHDEGNVRRKEIISFDLSNKNTDEIEAAATAVLDTEILTSAAEENR